jgi:nicotinate-nucleotide adenylyltransferase
MIREERDKSMRIGILGGTFDPIHIGHLSLGEHALEAFNLDEVWFMPNGLPPHKYTGDVSDVGLGHRIQMIESAIEDNLSFKLSLQEARTDAISYTYSTLKVFNKVYPTYQFYFIVGADALFSIEDWMNFTEIFQRCTILAALRGDSSIKSLVAQIKRLEDIHRGKIEILQAPLLEISSSEIRERVKDNKSISYMVTKDVDRYIKENSLYVIKDSLAGEQTLSQRLDRSTLKAGGERSDESPIYSQDIQENKQDKSQDILMNTQDKFQGEFPGVSWYRAQTYLEKKYDLEKFNEVLKTKLSFKRYLHTQGVMYTAAALAMRYQVNIFDAMTAGVLHDCGKYTTLEAQKEDIKRYNIILSDDEREIPSLIHAPLGAYLAKNDYEVTEESILSAILYHSTGRPDMTMLEKIVYIADYIEPYRGDEWKYRMIRDIAFTHIDKAVWKCAELTIASLKERNRNIGKMTIKTLEFYGGENNDAK